MFFRIHIDEVYHKKMVYNFMDWVADIGGLQRGVFAGFATMFGGYITFCSKIELMLHLYSNKGMHKKQSVHSYHGNNGHNHGLKEEIIVQEGHFQKHELDSWVEEDEQLLDYTSVKISRYNRMRVYFCKTFKCLKFNKKLESMNNQINRGIDSLKLDLDILHIIT